MNKNLAVKYWALFPFPPASLKYDLYALTSDLTRLFMKTKYVCHSLLSLHVNFQREGKRAKYCEQTCIETLWIWPDGKVSTSTGQGSEFDVN